MSRTKRYPELSKADLRNGVSYACAYLRLGLGWPFARAVSEPPRKIAPRLTPEQRREKYDAKRARAARMIHKRITTPRVIHQRTTRDAPTPARALLARYCDHFIKTGILDPDMARQLKDYADDKRASHDDLERVPAEHATRRYRRKAKGDGEHGLRDDVQIDEGTCRSIGVYLRSR
jgi:hypothetical protein